LKYKLFSVAMALVLALSLCLIMAAPAMAATTWYVSTSGNDSNAGGSGDPFATIQKAVDMSGSGDTIVVLAGTYTGGFEVNGKTNLTIKGGGYNSTIITPTALINTGVAHKYTANMQAVVSVNGSTDITIQDMGIKSTTSTPGSGGADAIVFWNASSGTISFCKIQGVYTISGAQTGQGIAVDASGTETATLTLSDTNISGFQKNGIDILDGNGAEGGSTDTITVNVSGGSITGAGPTSTIAQNGICFWDRGGGTLTGMINGVTISGFDYTPGDTEACGILDYHGANLNIIHCNFTEDEIAVDNEDSGATVTAEHNWWGDASGPYNASTNSGGTGCPVSDNVDFDPWATGPYGAGQTDLVANAPDIVAISVSPSTINFGIVHPGDTTDPHTITVTNIGTHQNLTVDATVYGANLFVQYLRLDGNPPDHPPSWYSLMTGLNAGASDTTNARLVIAADYAPEENATGILVFTAY
jgi:hypothetical protein